MKTLNLLVIAVLLVMVSGVQASFFWDNSSGNQLWNEPTNWVGDAVPDGTSYFYINTVNAATAGPIVETGVNTDFTGQRGYVYGTDGTPTGGIDLNLTGGSLTNILRLYIGYDGNTGVLNVSDDAYLSTTTSFYLGYKGPGYLNMTGGTIDIIGSFIVGFGYAAEAHIDGGVVHNVNQLVIQDGVMDITAGQFELRTNQVDVVNGFIATGKLSGYGYFDTDHVIVEFDEVGNKTIVTAVPEPATMMLLGIGGFVLSSRKQRKG